jgi:GxxExxY protein
MTVHTTLGSGFREVIYHKALSIELKKHNIEFQSEKYMAIFYDNINIGARRVDFFVENKIMLELKAVSMLDDMHVAQAMNYLEAYNLPVGLLINFGTRSLTFKRIFNTKHPDNANYKKPS